MKKPVDSIAELVPDPVAVALQAHLARREAQEARRRYLASLEADGILSPRSSNLTQELGNLRALAG